MPDFSKLMKQAQEMQSKMQNMQSDLESATHEGKSGGGMVTISVSGNGQMKSVSIDQSIINPDEKEILEDLIIAAFNAAKSKSDAASENATSGMFDEMKLPPGFKF